MEIKLFLCYLHPCPCPCPCPCCLKRRRDGPVSSPLHPNSSLTLTEGGGGAVGITCAPWSPLQPCMACGCPLITIPRDPGPLGKVLSYPWANRTLSPAGLPGFSLCLHRRPLPQSLCQLLSLRSPRGCYLLRGKIPFPVTTANPGYVVRVQ